MRISTIVTLLALLMVSCAWGQLSTSGAIAGVITDPQGQPVPGARVTITNLDFSSKRTSSSDETGRFMVGALAPGNYSVQAEISGFKPAHVARLMLRLGSTVHLNLRLQMQGPSEQVTVHGRAPNLEGNTVAPAVNAQESEASTFIPGMTVTYLPNRDRDFTQFGSLSPASVPDPSGDGPVVAGQRAQFSANQVDGGNFNDPLQGGRRGSTENAAFLPQTVVREFEVVRAGAGAEVSGTNAGLFNILTKEGSNKFHGEAFYFGRPPALASSDAFGRSVDNLQNQFGGSIGGPWRKNRAFFYAGFEQDFLHTSYWTEFLAQSPGTLVPSALADQQSRSVEKSNPTALFGRTDVILNSANTLNFEVTYNHLHDTGLGVGLARVDFAPSHSGTLDENGVWTRASLTTLLGSRFVNQAALQWSNDDSDFVANSSSAEMVINGFGILGGNSLYPHHYTSGQLQASEDLAISHKSVLLHLGTQVAYSPATEIQESFLNGRFDFSSLEDYLLGQPRRFQQTFTAGDIQYDASVRQLGLYFTARAPLNSRLTLTAGLRWDGQWNPQPSNTNPGVAQTRRIPNDLKQWQPRFGLAWNPAGNTVVRVSAGLYDAATPATLFHRVFSDNGVNTITADSYFDPQLLPLVIANGLQPFANPPSGLNLPAARVIGIASDFRNPRSFQFSGGLEQQITKTIGVTASYLRNSTWALPSRVDLNLNAPTYDAQGLPIFPPARPNPLVGQLLVNQSNAHSSYDGLLLGANFQISRRTQVTANYTLSRARDDSPISGAFDRDAVLNPFHLSTEAASSNFDARHNLNVSAVINLPHGFKFNPVLLARSGFTYTPVVGLDLQNDANDWNDRAIVNGTVVPRNSARQPSFANLDIRFVKDFTLRGEGHHLDLFLDVFNVTGANNLNFGASGTSVFGPPSQPVFTAGQPLFAPDTNHFGGARQIQFTARIVAF